MSSSCKTGSEPQPRGAPMRMRWDPRYKAISIEPSIPRSGCSDVCIMEVHVGKCSCLGVGDLRVKV